MTENRRPLLLLVNPRQTLRHYSVQFGLARLVGRRSIMPSLVLATLAAHTPDHWDIRILDEEVEKIPDDLKPDLVGITALTNTVDRAYELCLLFRRRGARVVLGGPHASYAVQETLLHANAVVVGEAETIWAQVLEDCETQTMRRVYQGDGPFALETQRMPRWDLVDTAQYVSLPVQASRGCPYSCDFCLVARMFGRKMRFRAIDSVIDEIKSLPLKRIFFVDDNFTINRRFANELIERLAPLGVSWSCQASIDIADDEALIRRMADAGCGQVLIGFESLNPESISETHKSQNRRERYERAIERIHGMGMHVIGSFIIGFDHDTIEELDRILDFCDSTGLCFVSINVLGANPGTALYERLEAEGRLRDVPNEWRGGMMPVIEYMRITQRDALVEFSRALRKLFSYEAIGRRAKLLFGNGTFTRHHGDDDVSGGRKALTTLHLVRHFLFSRDKAKRRLFLWMLSQIRA
ncbi:MAG: radical SAM protein, partial [Chitinivibrionales bacterium]|nr:radical SAM protein [Chitinivibrionales bacterium]